MRRLVIFLLILSMALCLFACSPRLPTNEYLVTFDSMGGSSVTAIFVKEIEEPPVPKKEGYIFEGWYEKENYEGKMVDFPYTPGGKTTLYAKYVDVEVGNEELGFSPTADGSGYYVYAYGGYSDNVCIPDYHKGKPVVGIREEFFNDCEEIINLYFGKNIEIMPKNYNYMRSLESFYLRQNSEFFSVIGGALYSGEGSTLLYLPPEKEFSDGVFRLPDGVVKTERGSLRKNRSITSIDLNEVTDLGDKLHYLPNLASISADNESYKSVNGVLYDRDMKALLACPVAYGSTLVVADGTERIEEDALADTEVKFLELNESLVEFSPQNRPIGLVSISVEIGNSRYESKNGVLYDKLNDSIVLYPPSKGGDFSLVGVSDIGNGAFSYCQGIDTLTIGKEVTHIGNFAFSFSTIRYITFEEGSLLKKIENLAFSGETSLESISFTAVTPPTFLSEEELDFDLFVPKEGLDLYRDEWRAHYENIKTV